jgi:hypothetical protein
MLQEDILTTTFFDVERMINKAVWKFYYMYGGELDDWKAEAHLVFMKAYNSYDDSVQVKFTTYLHTLLHTLLQSYYINYVSRTKTLIFNHEELLENIEDPGQQLNRLVDLLDEMKKDAQALVQLIWEMPEELKKTRLCSCNKSRYYKSNHAMHMKVFLKAYLRKLGWTHTRIQRVFSEIGEKINA